MKYKAIVFDVDGTLYTPGQISSYMASLALKHPIISRHYAGLRKQVRLAQEDYRALGLENADFQRREAFVYANICHCANTAEKALEKLNKHFYGPLMKEFYKIVADENVPEVFDYLRKKGLTVGVLSDWPFGDKLSILGIKDKIDFAYTPDDIGYLKPSVHCFNYLINNLKLDASEVLYVGDSYEKDVLGPGKVGIDAVLINCKDSEVEKKYPKAIKVFGTWDEFSTWLTTEVN